MATYKNHEDGVLITQEPTFITEWEENFTQIIQFTLPEGKEANIGDRIYVRTDLGTRGKNIGTPVDVYYILQGGIKKEGNNVTAAATRVEL